MIENIFHEFLFPTHLVGSTNTDFYLYKNKIIDYAESLYNKNPNSSKNNIGPNGPGSSNAWRSESMFFADGSFDFFLNEFKEQIAITVQQIGLINIPLYFSGAWITINAPNSYLLTHVHSDCLLSGVMWVDIPENSGNLVFTNTNSWHSPEIFDSVDDSIRNNYNHCSKYFFPPIEGKMIIFPAYLPHYVTENNSSKNRISITFNLTKHPNSFCL
jgi:hypothetical protein